MVKNAITGQEPENQFPNATINAEAAELYDFSVLGKVPVTIRCGQFKNVVNIAWTF
jgi:hypothetical protein